MDVSIPFATSSAPVRPGKAERTRARILTAAIDLFTRGGYEKTTVAQIAAAAGITEMTFYRHFGSKDQLLVDDPYDPLIVAAIAEQPRVATRLAPRAARGVRSAWRNLPITDEEPVRERLAIVASTPEPHARRPGRDGGDRDGDRRPIGRGRR